MQDIQWLVWSVGFLFYIPLHVGLPLLYLLVQEKMPSLTKGVKYFLLENTVIGLVVYIGAALLWSYSMVGSISILVLLMLHPWYRVLTTARS